MRSVRIAICTSGEPVSVSWRRCSEMVMVVSGMRGLAYVREREGYQTPWARPRAGSAGGRGGSAGETGRREDRRRGAGPGPSRVGDRDDAVAGSRGEAEHGARRADTGTATATTTTGVRAVALVTRRGGARHVACRRGEPRLRRPTGSP